MRLCSSSLAEAKNRGCGDQNGANSPRSLAVRRDVEIPRKRERRSRKSARSSLRRSPSKTRTSTTSVWLVPSGINSTKDLRSSVRPTPGCCWRKSGSPMRKSASAGQNPFLRDAQPKGVAELRPEFSLLFRKHSSARAARGPPKVYIETNQLSIARVCAQELMHSPPAASRIGLCRSAERASRASAQKPSFAVLIAAASHTRSALGRSESFHGTSSQSTRRLAPAAKMVANASCRVLWSPFLQSNSARSPSGRCDTCAASKPSRRVARRRGLQ